MWERKSKGTRAHHVRENHSSPLADLAIVFYEGGGWLGEVTKLYRRKVRFFNLWKLEFREGWDSEGSCEIWHLKNIIHWLPGNASDLKQHSYLQKKSSQAVKKKSYRWTFFFWGWGKLATLGLFGGGPKCPVDPPVSIAWCLLGRQMPLCLTDLLPLRSRWLWPVPSYNNSVRYNNSNATCPRISGLVLICHCLENHNVFSHSLNVCVCFFLLILNRFLRLLCLWPSAFASDRQSCYISLQEGVGWCGPDRFAHIWA